MIGLALDLWSKDWAFTTLRQGGRRVLIPHVLEFQTMLNPGALFGFGAGQTMLFLGASLLALVLVLWMFAHCSPRRRVLHIALGGILAGALGNMYDRGAVQLIAFPVSAGTRFFVSARADATGVVLKEYPPSEDGVTRFIPDARRAALPPPTGHVRDFIKINTTVGGRELWPWVFNVADVLLVGGVGVLAIYLWRDRKTRPKAGGFAVDAAEGTP
ncbi:MAG: signal peptidase II [Planctomycetes bacterium]|nr:signal peptidase II [Planctomycetota bacterium]